MTYEERNEFIIFINDTLKQVNKRTSRFEVELTKDWQRKYSLTVKISRNRNNAFDIDLITKLSRVMGASSLHDAFIVKTANLKTLKKISEDLLEMRLKKGEAQLLSLVKE